jgi:small-conductance mechanosensitive channel
MTIREILEYTLLSTEKFQLTVADILAVALVLLGSKMLIWTINEVFLERFFKRKHIDAGRQYALRTFSSYVVYVLATFLILEIIGISSMLWASSAALLVGVGLGLQDTFKDLISGIVILVEGTVEVNDVIEVGGLVAIVREIGLRTSVVETQDHVSILIPNSKLVIDNVINWSHNDAPTRFIIRVGVAYGSDTALVTDLLIRAARENPKVLDSPAISVQFKDFGNSSLDFDLLFYSEEFFRIEVVKSQIRYAIDRLFREHNVSIPFPQRDLWIRNAEVLK